MLMGIGLDLLQKPLCETLVPAINGADKRRSVIMESYIYNYETWLAEHANRKTMMEKLERSLVPYELFEAIGLRNDKQPVSGEVSLQDNVYHYDISYDYQCMGREVYDAVLNVTQLGNKWHNILMGYNKFKVVMEGHRIKTIYSDHEDYFHQVIGMLERDDYGALYANRSAYINNLLARYILLRLLEAHRPELQLLASVKTDEAESVGVVAADPNRNELFMYAFSKREALELAKRHDGICRNLTVVYFFNQDFEKDGNMVGYDSGCTRVVSARTFMLGMPMGALEKRLVEKRLLMLVGLLYNEHLDRHFDKVERVAVNPPFYGKTIKEQKKAAKEAKTKKGKKTKKMRNQLRQNLPWYYKIPRTLLEDALNVITDHPVKLLDIFHFLCAANLVNAYVNQCNQQHGKFAQKLMTRMFQAKQQIFKCLLQLAEEHNPNVKITMNSLPAVLVNIRVEKKDYQISFRGMTQEMLDRFCATGISQKGFFEGYYLQPIATALYMYSHMLRWRELDSACH